MTGIALGSTAFAKLALGTTAIQNVSLGTSLVWTAAPTFTPTATDNFNRSNGALGSNWYAPQYQSGFTTGIGISSNAVTLIGSFANSYPYQPAVYTATAASQDTMYARVTVSANATSSVASVIGLRFNSTMTSGIGLAFWGGNALFYRFTGTGSGNVAALGTQTTQAIANGDIITVVANGYVYKAYLNNATTPFCTYDDTTAKVIPIGASNRLGMMAVQWSSSVLSATMDNFEVGNVANPY